LTSGRLIAETVNGALNRNGGDYRSRRQLTEAPDIPHREDFSHADAVTSNNA